MDFEKLILTRYSVRKYKPDPVSDKDLTAVLNAGRMAPTACNLQPFRILVIRTAENREGLSRIYSRAWFVRPPLVLGVCALPDQGWSRQDGKKYAEIDTAIAMDHIILAAANLGLGTCWIGAFNPAAARDVLNLPPEAEPVAFTPLGYPADAIREKRRKSLDDLVIYDRWD